jgi:hypothetical protein
VVGRELTTRPVEPTIAVEVIVSLCGCCMYREEDVEM